MENKDFDVIEEGLYDEISVELFDVVDEFADVKETVKEPLHETVVEQANVPDEKQMAQYFVKRPGGAILGGFMEFFGFSFAVLMGIILVGFIALDIVFQGVSFLLIVIVVLAVIVALCLLIGIRGRIIRGRAKRFKLYKRILNGREICDIEELAEEAEKSAAFVVKDLTRMIDRKWFLQGHLDSAQKHLIITDTMYEQYTLVMEKMGR